MFGLSFLAVAVLAVGSVQQADDAALLEDLIRKTLGEDMTCLRKGDPVILDEYVFLFRRLPVAFGCTRNSSLPLYGAASTDIVKPAVDRLPESVFNELFCERLAADCGIDAARCDVVRFGRETCYRTVRYDRYAAGVFRPAEVP